MKALFINGSPRKNFNTAQLIDEAMRGAQDAGADVERINLFDYEFTDCRECYACKIKNSRTMGSAQFATAFVPFWKRCMRPMSLLLAVRCTMALLLDRYAAF